MPSPAHPLVDVSRELAALAEQTARSTVCIRGVSRLTSSGFIWRPGLVVTSEEALETDQDVTLLAPDGSEIVANLAGRDPSTAVALLKIDDTALPPLAAGAVPKLGEIAIVAGRASAGATVQCGTVALLGGPWRSLRGGAIDALIRLDLVVSRTSEGGAVVDAEGKLVGMLVFGPRRRPLVIPYSTLDRVAAHLLVKGRVARAYLGLGLRTIRLEGEGGRGLIVISVDPDGPAHQAGMFIGDVITAWDDETVGGMRGLMRRLGGDGIGQTVTLGVLRAGAHLEIRLTIAERPA